MNISQNRVDELCWCACKFCGGYKNAEATSTWKLSTHPVATKWTETSQVEVFTLGILSQLTSYEGKKLNCIWEKFVQQEALNSVVDNWETYSSSSERFHSCNVSASSLPTLSQVQSFVKDCSWKTRSGNLFSKFFFATNLKLPQKLSDFTMSMERVGDVEIDKILSKWIQRIQCFLSFAYRQAKWKTCQMQWEEAKKILNCDTLFVFPLRKLKRKCDVMWCWCVCEWEMCVFFHFHSHFPPHSSRILWMSCLLLAGCLLSLLLIQINVTVSQCTQTLRNWVECLRFAMIFLRWLYDEWRRYHRENSFCENVEWWMNSHCVFLQFLALLSFVWCWFFILHSSRLTTF